MQCKTCNEDVPPKFTFAIAKNMCPLCGGEIMPAKLQEILKNLKTLMDEGQEFQTDLDDWFMSNYSMKKFDPTEMHMHARKSGKGFSVKRSDEDSVEQDESDDSQPTTVFAERAGIKPKKSFKQLIKEIEGRSGGAADPSEFLETNESEIEEDPMMKPLDIKGRKDLEDMFEQDAQTNSVLEQEKLRRLRNQAAGSGGFRRGD